MLPQNLCSNLVCLWVSNQIKLRFASRFGSAIQNAEIFFSGQSRCDIFWTINLTRRICSQMNKNGSLSFLHCYFYLLYSRWNDAFQGHHRNADFINFMCIRPSNPGALNRKTNHDDFLDRSGKFLVYFRSGCHYFPTFYVATFPNRCNEQSLQKWAQMLSISDSQLT